MAFAIKPSQPTDVEVADSPPDTISAMAFAPAGPANVDYLAVSAWDNNVRVYEVTNTGQSKGIAMYSHQAPALSVIWSPDGSKIISGGCDNAARMYDVQTGQSTQVAAHDQPIRSLAWVNIPSAPDCHLVTGSWDKTLKYWDMRSPNPIATVTLPERLYSLDTAGQYLVAACADRQNVVYNLNDPSKPFKTPRSALKWQTRAVKCFPVGTCNPGFVVGSIEGRVGVCYIEGPESDNYSFRCHRTETAVKPAQAKGPNQNIYAVNAFAFNHLGTVATMGGDGSFSIWDTDNKQRLKEVSDRGGPLVAGDFNRTGTIFAYGIGYDWSQGHQGNANVPNKIMLHALKSEDITKRSKKK